MALPYVLEKINELSASVKKAQGTADGSVKALSVSDDAITYTKNDGNSEKVTTPYATTTFTINIRDELRAYVEHVSGGRRTIVRNDKGDPSVMYVVPKFKLEDIDSTLGTGVHPAFIIGGKEKNELLIGAYPASLLNDRAVSLAHQKPYTSLTIDKAVEVARQSGTGFHCMTNIEWGAVAMMCWKNSWNPRGNTNYGRSHSNKDEVGTLHAADRVPGDTKDGLASTLTGTGPASWCHDGTSMGLADLVGNVWEFSPGLRSKAGEIQVIENNNAALATCDLSANSSEWKAILASDGTLVAPSTTTTNGGTVKIDHTSATTPCQPKLNTTVTNTPAAATDGEVWYKNQAYTPFKDLKADFQTIPAVLKIFGVYPMDSKLEGYIWTFNTDERMALRGGTWINGAHAGLAALIWHNARTLATGSVGFRLAFYS